MAEMNVTTGHFPFNVPMKAGDHWQEVSLVEACFLSLCWKRVKLEATASRTETATPTGGGTPLSNTASFAHTLINDAPRITDSPQGQLQYFGVGSAPWVADERMMLGGGPVLPVPFLGEGFGAHLGPTFGSFYDWPAASAVTFDAASWRHQTTPTPSASGDVSFHGYLFHNAETGASGRVVLVPRARPCFQLAADYGVTPTKWYVRPALSGSDSGPVITAGYLGYLAIQTSFPYTYSGGATGSSHTESGFIYGLMPFSDLSESELIEEVRDESGDGEPDIVITSSTLRYIKALGEVGTLKLVLRTGRELSWDIYGAATLGPAVESFPSAPGPGDEVGSTATTGPSTVTFADGTLEWDFEIDLKFSLHEAWPFIP